MAVLAVAGSVIHVQVRRILDSDGSEFIHAFGLVSTNRYKSVLSHHLLKHVSADDGFIAAHHGAVIVFVEVSARHQFRDGVLNAGDLLLHGILQFLRLLANEFVLWMLTLGLEGDFEFLSVGEFNRDVAFLRPHKSLSIEREGRGGS